MGRAAREIADDCEMEGEGLSCPAGTTEFEGAAVMASVAATARRGANGPRGEWDEAPRKPGAPR